MTDRRRNLFILLLVAGLLAASLTVILSKPTKRGLDLQGGVELVYEARPTQQQPVVDQEALDRAIEVMRDRVDNLGVSEPEIQRSGSNQILVGLPDVDNAEDAQRQVGQVAQLFFYDWEPNVIGPDGKPAPRDPEVTGGQSAGQVGSMSLFDAVQIASERPAVRDGNNTHEGLFYAVDEKDKEVVAGPEESREDLEEDVAALPADERDAKIVEVKEGTVIVRAEQRDGLNENEKSDRWFVLADNVALRGTDIKNPEQNYDNSPGGSGQPIVTFDFSDEGRRIWRDVTREIARRGASQSFGNPQAAAQHFAIVLDNELISVPYIDFVQNPNGIDASNGSQIQGGFTIQSAQELSNLLKTGALPVKLELISQSQVSATLGKQSLNQGLIAGATGLALVALFLLIFYRILGLIAVTALGVFALYFFALIKLIPITLTLPGIAGLILTIGIAADANIVIFERVKEEIRAGRSVTAGLAAGYKKGVGAIIDANVVTVMVAFILFVLATAGVKGFAFTLGVGTIVSLFTAVLFTQAIVGTLGHSKLLARPSALGASTKKEHRPIRFDFMGTSKWFFSASGVILIVCALGIGAKGLELGIDFESGTRIKTAFTQPANEDQVREVLAGVGQREAEIQRVQEPELGNSVFQISTGNLPPDQVTRVTSALDDRFTIRGEPNTQSIGPTFGQTIARNAIIAIIASLFVVAIYLSLRFGFKYAMPVLIALSHDILITAGIYALIGQQVTASTVAAALTILGFSLYDTIIVFDRIRENVPRMPAATFSQVVNRSMSEVIVRSLATSLTTVLPLLMLYLFGGETLRDFAIALLIGTVSGTYSSIFIASQVLTHWKEREPLYKRRRARVMAENGGMVPAYATGNAGTIVDPQPSRRSRGRLTAPDDPDRGVSREEFDEMVRDLHVDDAPASTAVQEREPEDTRASADATPDDLYMKDDKRDGGGKKPRNKRHGRNR